MKKRFFRKTLRNWPAHKIGYVGLLLALIIIPIGFSLTILLPRKLRLETTLTPTTTPTYSSSSPLPEPPLPSPSPTPNIEKIIYKPDSTWQTYTDTTARFSIQYPSNYKLNDVVTGKSVNFLNCGQSTAGPICTTGYSVNVFDDYDGGSRRAWLNRKQPGFLIEPYFQDALVAGSKALIAMDGNTGGSTGSFILIPKGNRMYLFVFPFGWNPETKEKSGLDFIKQILSTFRIL